MTTSTTQISRTGRHTARRGPPATAATTHSATRAVSDTTS